MEDIKQKEEKKPYYITEVYLSVQGESMNTGSFSARFGVGTPTIFLRFMGCGVRCSWCDTKFTWDKSHPNYGDGAHRVSLDEIMDILTECNTCDAQNVCITGGDPDSVPEKHMEILIKTLRSNGYKVSVEASGRLNPSRYKHAHSIVMDIKCPSAGKVAMTSTKNAVSYISNLSEKDQIKFVIANEEDYEFMLNSLRLASDVGEIKPVILASPFFNSVGGHNARWLVDLILNQDEFPINLNFQLHKAIWEIDQRAV